MNTLRKSATPSQPATFRWPSPAEFAFIGVNAALPYLLAGIFLLW